MPTFVLTHNPTTITTPVTVAGTAVYGGPAQAWDVTNLSAISGTSAGKLLGVGILLKHGGRVTNGAATANGASISGDENGVRIDGAPGAVVNFGAIAGGYGVFLNAGGTVVNGAANDTKASIVGRGTGAYDVGQGVRIRNGPGTVTNFGTISSSANAGESGVSLDGGGTVANHAGALISGGEAGLGVLMLYTSGTVTNYGTITSKYAGNLLGAPNSAAVIPFLSARYGGGVRLGGGTIINGAKGAPNALIAGGQYGIYMPAGTVTNFGTIVGGSDGILIHGTVTNGGTIIGVDANAIDFGNGDDRLIVEPGAVFRGAVNGGGGADTVDFAHFGADKISNFIGFGTIVLADGGPNTLTLNDASFVGVDGGSITVVGGNAGNTIDASALTGSNRVVLFGGAGSDVFKFSAASLLATDLVTGGSGADTLAMTTAGAVRAGGVSGVETFALASGGANSLTLANANFTGTSITVYGGGKGNTINASGLTGTHRLVAVGGAGRDLFTGGAGNDIFKFSAASLAATDMVKGGLGSDELVMTTAGAVAAAGVGGVEAYILAGGAADILTLTSTNFTGVTGASITVDGGNAGNTVDATAETAATAPANRVVAVGGAGKDVFTGGAGNDIFKFSAAALGVADTVVGGSGSDELLLTTAGTIATAGVRGVESYVLAGGAANALTLKTGNFTGVAGGAITIVDGGGGTTVNASAEPTADHVVVHAGSGVDRLTGGAGGDVFFAGGKTVMTGKTGRNQFVFSAPGGNTIADFAVSSTNEIAFGNAGFKLHLSGAGASPKPLPASLFTENSTGAFTKTTERFAYDTANGKLFFSASGTTATEHLVVTLAGDPTLTASHLFFVT